jgi:hypothetical protein
MSTVYNPTHVVIKNIGNARAGTFKVVIGAAGNVPAQSVRISGLAAGASTKIAAQSACEVSRQVKVDVLNEVIESNGPTTPVSSRARSASGGTSSVRAGGSPEPPAPTPAQRDGRLQPPS